MFGLDDYVIKDIVSIISKYNEIDKACIFGSRARGNYKPTSDIDIAIFCESISSTRMNLLRNDIDMLDIIYKVDLLHFESMKKEALIDNILKESIAIYIK